MVVYAKSNPPEDLKNHTENLLREFKTLKDLYGERIKRCVPKNFIEYFWDALELAIKYHDLGKIHTPFQNKIRERLKMPLIPTTIQEAPHNLLSPAFLNGEVLKSFPEELHTVIYQSIAYHHDKDREGELVENPKKWDIIEKIVSDDLLPNLDKLSDMKTLVKLPNSLKKLYRKRIEKRFKATDGDVYKIYVLLKGLLHRIDHAA
ncbi:MAG: CRISPR-associated endonuclease Cas3'', partial [Candidatus Omnitrophota bacterium]